MQTIFFTVSNDISYDQRMIRICASLAKAGYKVCLVGRKKTLSIPLKNQLFHQKRLYCFFQKGKLFYLEYNLRLFIHLSFKSYDALCAIDLDTLGPLFLLSKIRRKPLIYDAHEYFTEVPELVDRPLTQSVWEKLAQLIIPQLKYCYTVGPQLAVLFQQRYGPEFKVIKNVPVRKPIDYEETKNIPFIPSGVQVILYQGALNVGRGLECSLEAMLLLPEDFHLWLVGEGDLSEELRTLSKKLELQKRVHFLGFRTPQELPAITKKAHLGLNLLENKGLSYYYSLANKCFDYIQAELPAIHMDFPEYRSLYQEHQAFALLSNLDPKLLATMIQHILQDNLAYQAMQQACREAALVWNWEIEEKELLVFYQNIFVPQN